MSMPRLTSLVSHITPVWPTTHVVCFPCHLTFYRQLTSLAYHIALVSPLRPHPALIDMVGHVSGSDGDHDNIMQQENIGLSVQGHAQDAIPDLNVGVHQFGFIEQEVASPQQPYGLNTGDFFTPSPTSCSSTFVTDANSSFLVIWQHMQRPRPKTGMPKSDQTPCSMSSPQSSTDHGYKRDAEVAADLGQIGMGAEVPLWGRYRCGWV
ncbi:hypothetical protein GUJ93_ZPchr0010g7854 [Zizania palustris]|uniref:Uncharacterized protein n=1 Tax=Zizania palustris TaxID=103762 RepID=A0A8J5W8J2_ZIZPA|nr:hypothetical protein GUJ93_ZPchr0010g7854 [Zizania palustris]